MPGVSPAGFQVVVGMGGLVGVGLPKRGGAAMKFTFPDGAE
jgi:hypothetical protein